MISAAAGRIGGSNVLDLSGTQSRTDLVDLIFAFGLVPVGSADAMAADVSLDHGRSGSFLGYGVLSGSGFSKPYGELGHETSQDVRSPWDSEYTYSLMQGKLGKAFARFNLAVLEKDRRSDDLSVVREAMEVLDACCATFTLSQPINDDFFIGNAGTIYAAAQVVRYGRVPLQTARDVILPALVSVNAKLDHFLRDDEMMQLSFAHGVFGMLYVMLGWSELDRDDVQGRLEEIALRLLSYEIEASGRWPAYNHASAHNENSMPRSLCNGSSGVSLALWKAYAATKNEAIREAAQRASGYVGKSVDPNGSMSVCCGVAGQALALHSAYRATNDARWSRRASELSEFAARTTLQRISDGQAINASLLKGHLGQAVLARAELTGAPATIGLLLA